MRTYRVLILLIACAALLAPSASADPIIVGSPLQPSGGIMVFVTQWVAKAFSLNGFYDISQISVQMGGGSNGTFFLTKGLDSSSVLFQQDFGTGAGQYDFNVNLTLGPDTYYIVLGQIGFGKSAGSWSDAGYYHIENGGTVGLTYCAYDPNGAIQQTLDSSWISQGDYPVDFQVTGTPTVPEPTSLLLLSLGLVGLIGCCWRHGRG